MMITINKRIIDIIIMDPQPKKIPKPKDNKNTNNQIDAHQIDQMLHLKDRQQLRQAISSLIKPLNFKKKNQLSLILQKSITNKYAQSGGQTSIQILEDMKEMMIAMKEIQVSTPLIDIFFQQYLKTLKQLKHKYPQVFEQKNLMRIWQWIPHKDLQTYLKQLNLLESFDRQDEEQFQRILSDLLNDRKMQQVCSYILIYHSLIAFQENLLAPKLATSDQIYSTMVIKTLKHKQGLKLKVLELIDPSKAVPLLEQLGQDPREYEQINKFILRKHYLSMNHQYKQWYIFEDKMDFNPLFIKWYCDEHEEIDQKIRDSMLARSSYAKNKQGLYPNPLFSKDQFTVAEVILNQGNHQDIENQHITLRALGITQENTFFVDSTQHSPIFDQMAHELMESKYVGFDAENRCTSTKYEQQGVSLIQLSTTHRSYVIDFYKLETDDKFLTFFRRLLQNQNVKKIGHTIQSDIRFLQKTIDIDAKKIGGFIDLSKIFKQKFPNQQLNSLAFMCYKLIGKKLSKYQQRSNWNRRPLKRTQMHYAALDATVCLTLYKILLQKQIDLDSVTEKMINNRKETDQLIRKDQMVYSKDFQKILQCKRPKFLIDSMLKKLCSIMRNLGIDSQYMSVSNFQVMKQIAEKEQRIILTRDTKLLAKRSHKMPVYLIAEKGDSDKMFQQIKQAFNLDLSLFKPLSRCVKCNGSQLEVISREQAMKSIVFQYQDNKIQDFWRCEKCKQIYWEGNQFHKAKNKFTHMK